MFAAPVDIANRACQHIGAKRIIAFTDDVVQATELGFVYDKLRRRELRRNVWGFSIRRAVLRPISTTSMTLTPTSWLIGTTYALGQIAAYDDGHGVRTWQSTVASNLGNTPGDTSTVWSLYFGPKNYELYPTVIAPTAFAAGEVIYTDSTHAYISLVGNNSDVPPSSNWLQLNGTLAAYAPLYPAGAGPANDLTTRNVFLLPLGFLREAPQDPKAGFLSFLGAPTERMLKDWVFENGMLVTQDPTAINMRFVADVANVPSMDDMFCEGLGAECGFAVCERVTQSTAKQAACRQAYEEAMTEARIVNGIEQGPTEPPMDEWINCRI